MLWVLMTRRTHSASVDALDDHNTEKYQHWLELILDNVDKGEFRNVSAGLSHLTAAGTVLEDPQIVYVAEFLEWLTNNLRPALVGKKTRPEFTESSEILKDSI